MRIRQARKQAGLSHDRLGELVGTSRQHLIKLEKGRHAPREELLQRIADATGKTMAFFTQDEDEDEDDGEGDLAIRLVETIRALVRAELQQAATGEAGA
jgi:transcriptional regulator with XRE-family HTH domain